MAYQVLMAQSNLGKAIQRGVVPKRMRMKKYFREAVLFFGIEAHVKGEEVPYVIRNAVPSDLLPWWPKRPTKRRRRSGRRNVPQSGT